MITDAQLTQYEEQGAVTIDSPFSEEQLDRAEAAWDRLKASGDPPYENPDYIDVVQHPFFILFISRVEIGVGYKASG